MKTTAEPTDKKLFLDVIEDKALIEERIARHIRERLPEADETEIMEAVDREYTRLLNGARVTMHIPTLTEKLAAEDVIAHRFTTPISNR